MSFNLAVALAAVASMSHGLQLHFGPASNLNQRGRDVDRSSWSLAPYQQKSFNFELADHRPEVNFRDHSGGFGDHSNNFRDAQVWHSGSNYGGNFHDKNAWDIPADVSNKGYRQDRTGDRAIRQNRTGDRAIRGNRYQGPSIDYSVRGPNGFQGPSRDFGVRGGRFQGPSADFGVDHGRNFRAPSSQFSVHGGNFGGPARDLEIDEPTRRVSGYERNFSGPTRNFGVDHGRNFGGPNGHFSLHERNFSGPNRNFGIDHGRSFQAPTGHFSPQFSAPQPSYVDEGNPFHGQQYTAPQPYHHARNFQAHQPSHQHVRSYPVQHQPNYIPFHYPEDVHVDEGNPFLAHYYPAPEVHSAPAVNPGNPFLHYPYTHSHYHSHSCEMPKEDEKEDGEGETVEVCMVIDIVDPETGEVTDQQTNCMDVPVEDAPSNTDQDQDQDTSYCNPWGHSHSHSHSHTHDPTEDEKEDGEGETVEVCMVIDIVDPETGEVTDQQTNCMDVPVEDAPDQSGNNDLPPAPLSVGPPAPVELDD